MKITAYEVREDETEIMKKLADKLGIDELVTTAEPLTSLSGIKECRCEGVLYQNGRL